MPHTPMILGLAAIEIEFHEKFLAVFLYNVYSFQCEKKELMRVQLITFLDKKTVDSNLQGKKAFYTFA